MPVPTLTPTGGATVSTPSSSRPFAPTAAASRRSDATALSVCPGVPKPSGLSASILAISSNRAGGAT